MQIKSTIVYHITPHVRMAIINKSTKVLVRMGRKGNAFALLVGMQIGAATVESSMEIPQTIKNGSAFWPSDPTSGNIIYLKEPKTLIWKNISTPTFIAVLATIAKVWKQPKCPSIDEWIKQLWDIYTIEFYSAVEKKKILPFATAWKDLENIMLSEISQSEKDKYHVFTHMWNLMNKQNYQAK